MSLGKRGLLNYNASEMINTLCVDAKIWLNIEILQTRRLTCDEFGRGERREKRKLSSELRPRQLNVIILVIS